MRKLLLLFAMISTLTSCGGDTTAPSQQSSDTTSATDSTTADDAADTVVADTVAADSATAVDSGALVCSEESQLALYEKRIKPLVDGSQPSSCNQCHLAGVDLSMYVQSDPCQTMACLVKQGMVDFKDPAKSKVLEQIKMAKPSSTLITEEVIAAEHDGFLEWITYSASCMDEVCGTIDDACNSPSPEVGKTGGTPAVLGSCEEKDLGALFQEKVWKWRGRCAPCHVAPGTPKFKVAHFFDGGYKPGDSAEQEAKSALYSMYNVIGINAVNVDEPAQSMLILQPLAPAAGGLPHQGHVKIANKQEQTYKDFLAWIEAYAECKKKQSP